MRFSTTVSDHVRSNVVGYVAVFIALSGTAYAVDGPLAGQNQVGSEDIINGEVKNNDLGANAVATGKIGDGQVQSSDLAAGVISDDVLNPVKGSSKIAADAVQADELSDSSVFGSEVAPNALTGDDIATNTIAGLEVTNESLGSVDLGPGSVGGSEVANDSLQGGDINESTLTALGGHDTFEQFCDPHSEAFVTCAELTFTLGRRMPVLTIFTYGFGNSVGDDPFGGCRTTLDGADTSLSAILKADGQTLSGFGGIPVVDVLTLDAGPHTIGLRCNELLPDDHDIEIDHIRIAAVELGMD
jgi:hypothetical protein